MTSPNPISVFTKYPINHFMRNRWFYPVYDATWLVLLASLIALMLSTGYQGLVPSFAAFSWKHLLTFPLLVYLLILSNVFAHNAAHRNFPKPINRLVGEMVGALVLTRYASWEVIHLRHHKYSDDPERDPHDCRPGFWMNFLPYFVLNVERQLKQHFYDYHGGPTPENVAFEKRRAVLSFVTGVALIFTFYLALGAFLFLLLFVPAQIVTIVHLAHFNWATHNGFSSERDYHPINIDRGLYWLGNRLLFGIYYHGNHHRTVKAFNPMHCADRVPQRRAVPVAGQEMDPAVVPEPVHRQMT